MKKICRTCQDKKNPNEFDRSRKNYLSSSCKACRKILYSHRARRELQKARLKKERERLLNILGWVERHKLIMEKRRLATLFFKDESFTSWLTEKLTQGIGIKQNINHAHVDFIRQKLGRFGQKPIYVELEAEPEAPHAADLSSFLRGNPWVDEIPFRHRVLICLLVMGFLKTEIAEVLGINVSELSREMHKIRARVKQIGVSFKE